MQCNSKIYNVMLFNETIKVSKDDVWYFIGESINQWLNSFGGQLEY